MSLKRKQVYPTNHAVAALATETVVRVGTAIRGIAALLIAAGIQEYVILIIWLNDPPEEQVDGLFAIVVEGILPRPSFLR
jgi:hypothetical protein